MNACRQALPLLILILLITTVPSDGAEPSDECLACHGDPLASTPSAGDESGDPSLTTERSGKTVSLHVEAAALAASSHRGLSCLDCHTLIDANNLPHRKSQERVDCLACHSDVAEKHPFHPQMAGATGEKTEVVESCKRCHGTHDVASRRGPDFPFHPTRLVESCGTCHVAVARQFQASEHGKALAAAVPGAPNCLTCHEKPLMSPGFAGDVAPRKLAQEKVCLSCHLDDPAVRARMAPAAGFIAAYESSVHGASLARGNGAAANCVDCHGSHEMRHGFDPEAHVNKIHIPETCARCHPAEAEKYAKSVHAVAIRRGNLRAPVCTDCHGEHNILPHTDPRSPVAPANVSAQVCSPCHSSLQLSEKYGIASDRFETFSDSYHGLAIRGGSVRVANCGSCHGDHDIRAAGDPSSTVNKANLAATCGKCHPGANRRFAIGPVHVLTAKPREPILYWVASFYVGLIAVVVGGMFLHNLLDFFRRARRRLRIRLGQPEEGSGRGLYLRMSLNERIQHGVLALSFTVLVITGFMLRYPDAWWVTQVRRWSTHAFDLRGLAHRAAGVVLIASGLFHIGYVALTVRGRQFLRDMLPTRGDVADFLGMVRYNLGVSSHKPRFGRFSYVEKSEYWALVWGTVVMAVTGIILWFENTFISHLTKLGWDVARTVHFYEAWLATLAILVWHFYYVIFSPDVYPMNSTWITGYLTETEMREEHPLELEAARQGRTEERTVESRTEDTESSPKEGKR